MRNWFFLSLLALLITLACTPAAPEQALVVRAIDGDTIELATGQRVRYIGIDTPETYPAVECYGREAWTKNRELVEGRWVRLEKDVSETDRYGRLLRYVWVDGVMVNAELVRLGYAPAVSYPPDVKHQELFRQLEGEAKGAGRGLWGVCPASSREPALAGSQNGSVK